MAAVVLAAIAFGGWALADDDQKLKWNGTIYTKWLWGDQRYDGSLYNFTTIPGEGFGDNGQGSEFELFLSARVSRQVEISGRIKARFNQNQWTNFGGFGDQSGGGDCIAGDCGEFDSRSAQYMKFRGAAVTLTPGYKWLTTAVIGSIRYIDRDNGSGLLFQGSNESRTFSYDFVRISLPRLWSGPNFNTGDYNVQDAAYGAQVKFVPNSFFDDAGVWEYVNDLEIDTPYLDEGVILGDNDIDDGRDLRRRFKNIVYGVRFGIHPNPMFDVNGRYYDSRAESFTDLQITNQAPESFFGLSGFSPVPAGRNEDEAWRLNLDINDPFEAGLSFNVELFDIGAEYVSMMAARRESDVLLTEGFDATWAFPDPAQSSFGVFPGNPSKIGYGGFGGETQQVATINADNEFTDFEEPLAETVIGWKGFTIVPSWSTGALTLELEYTDIGYNTDWQAFDMPTMDVTSTKYPVHELDSGVGHNFRSAYAPFQEKETTIIVLRGDYLVDIGEGLELFWKYKMIDEEDLRLNDPNFLPFQPGDCPGGTTACANNANFYFDNGVDQFSTASIYGNPPVIDADGDGTLDGYQWKPFDSLSDDDRDMDYTMFRIGAGYQLASQLYGKLAYEYYDVDLKDGNTAFQAYNLHQLSSGTHEKNKLILFLQYSLTGTEFGLTYEHNWGDFTPDFGTGFVTQFADEGRALSNNVPVGSPGFANRFGGWNSLLARDFTHDRLKAYMKVQF